MSSRTLRWIASLIAVVLGIMMLPFAVPVIGRVGGVTASASGTVLHADLLQTESTKLVDTEVAFSSAAFDSGGLEGAIFNEMDRVLAPSLPSKLSFGRGTAFEVGLGVSPTTENQAILAGKAEASALPNTAPVTKSAGPIDIDPLAYADLLRGEAMAHAADDGCALGTDASRGLAYVADAELLDTESSQQQQQQQQQTQTQNAAPVQQPAAPSGPLSGLTDAIQQVLPGATETEQSSTPPASSNTQAAAAADPPGLENPVVSLDAPHPAALSQSRSRTVFVAQRDRQGRRLGDNFGIMSEVRQTILPVTLFRGTPNALTIEFLGEWVLQAVAGGLPGTGYVHYGPGRASPDTPVLRLLRPGSESRILTLQQLVTNDGLVITIPGVAEVAIGEPPRAIGGPAGSDPAVTPGGTSTAAAVDVVRVKALPGAPVQLTDLRVGHMEVQAQVPAGGVSCSIPVTKTPSADRVDVGQFFDMTFKVTNPYDCTLTGVRLEDVITTEDAARFEVMATDPVATSVPPGTALNSGTITWTNIGDMASHSTRTLKARIGARGGAGAIIDRATASGTLAGCADPGATVAGVDVGVVGSGLTGTSAEVRTPVIATSVLSASSRNLPHTGAPILFLVAAALVSMAIGSASLLLASRLR